MSSSRSLIADIIIQVTVKAEPVKFKNPFIQSQMSYKDLKARLTCTKDNSITKTGLILILDHELKALKKENFKLKDALKAEKGGETWGGGGSRGKWVDGSMELL
ncbi:hypothetical protein DACRYDRAFT_15214 [Dacryopinax primogenitus]|uniref:Uncharacterized protein n=1 Tax=Dacryopinax primogenitus (strain DJM 731) TaxID=1858805 RepID=M5FZF4_DACPD|nr:uncharacterized protein DACRYDRAFT_15214 [Dacryopinax primogenitus]EJU03421.1 hypothetical protein DACRYDRAFT_15214 [Dacryopinax primogenitus]